MHQQRVAFGRAGLCRKHTQICIAAALEAAEAAQHQQSTEGVTGACSAVQCRRVDSSKYQRSEVGVEQEAEPVDDLIHTVQSVRANERKPGSLRPTNTLKPGSLRVAHRYVKARSVRSPLWADLRERRRAETALAVVGSACCGIAEPPKPLDAPLYQFLGVLQRQLLRMCAKPSANACDVQPIAPTQHGSTASSEELLPRIAFGAIPVCSISSFSLPVDPQTQSAVCTHALCHSNVA